MSLNHNQMAYAAIISTLIFGSLFVGISGFYQTSSGVGDFDSAAEEDINPNIAIQLKSQSITMKMWGTVFPIFSKNPNTVQTPMTLIQTMME